MLTSNSAHLVSYNVGPVLRAREELMFYLEPCRGRTLRDRRRLSLNS